MAVSIRPLRPAATSANPRSVDAVAPRDVRASTSDVDTIVVMGASGVGKTTIAQALAAATGREYAEGDSFHPPANVAKMTAGTPLTDEDRWPWLRRLRDWIGQREAAGASSVVTCSALKRAYRDVLREGNPSVRFLALTAGEDLLSQRMGHRSGHFMPAALLRSQLDTLEPLRDDEPGMAVEAVGDSRAVLARALGALQLTVPAGRTR